MTWTIAFNVNLYFSSMVTINGYSTNLNDGIGLRFVPYMIVGRNLGNAYEIVHNGNLKKNLEKLEKENRVDISSLDNKFKL